MSQTMESKVADEEDEVLETLYDVHEDLQTIANSDAEWSKYAKEGLDLLREAGYDV